MIDALANTLTSPLQGTRPTSIFCKALYAYFGIKIIVTWKIVSDITTLHMFTQPKSILSWIMFGPGVWGGDHIHIFLSMLLLIVVAALVVKPNYFLSTLIAWLSFNFYRLTFPVSNGSDQILITLLFFAVPLSPAPKPRGEILLVIQSSAYHTSKLFCRFFIISIYLISGLDKLGSEAWQSGDAIAFISKLPYMVNPGLAGWIPESEGGRFVLAWLTIAFELCFPVMIWFRPTRKWILLCGILFHAVIGLFLSLPDFGLVMILSYLIFLTDDDHKKLQLLLMRKK